MDIKFVDTSPQLYEEMLIKVYERITGRTLHPADPERMLINLITYAITVSAINIDDTGRMNLLPYARGEYLDALAELYGIQRLPAKPAVVIIRFELSSPLTQDVIIPIGTRVTPDGNIVFKTVNEVKIPAGQLYVDVQAECEQVGVVGNGYQIGQINKLVDILPYDISVSNITMSMYGTDTEDDERFRERIRLSMERFSNAGSYGAYIFYTKTAHQDIEDVEIYSPSPGVVKVLFLMKGGEIPGPDMIQLVSSYLNGEKVRPLTDQVIVAVPEVYTYDVDIEYYIHKKDEAYGSLINQSVEKAVLEFVKWTGSKIGRDILPEELISRVKKAGAYRVIINSPQYTSISIEQVAKPRNISIQYRGITED